jgi:hypothetical protein
MGCTTKNNRNLRRVAKATKESDMTTPTWFSAVADKDLAEIELKERMEYEQVKLQMLEMDVANTELRMRLLKAQIE